MESGDFRIDILLDSNKYKFKPESKVKKEKKKGVVRLIYTLLNDKNKDGSEMKALKFNSPKKEKSLKKNES